MRGELELVNAIRAVLAPANPVPAGDFEGDARFEADIAGRVTALRSAGLAAFDQPEPSRASQRAIGLDGGRGRTTWRLVAPALSGLAVVAVVVGLALAAGQGPAARRSSSGPSAGAAPLPRYYITINSKHFNEPDTVFVHSSLTGRTLGSALIPESEGYFAAAAARSDRDFFIVADRTIGHLRSTAALYRLRLAENGRVRSFTTISANLGFGDNTINAIALSPDGTRLAVAVQIPHRKFPEAELVVIPLNHGPRRTWTTRPEPAFILTPTWTSKTNIAFLWWDQLRGNIFNFVARTQVRLLDTTRAGSNLLSSRVLLTSTPTGNLGEINEAFAGPRGGPIIAATARTVPPLSVHGRATARLVALSPATGKVIKVFASKVLRYHDLPGLIATNYFFRVYAVDASGSHALVTAPGFGMLTGGKFAKLPAGPGRIEAVGW